MREFYIDGRVLGTREGLYCTDSKLVVTNDPPSGVLKWGQTLDTDATDCLNVALKLAGHDIKWRFEPKYLEALCVVMPSFRFNRTSTSVPWHMIAPTKFAAAATKRLIEDIRRGMEDMDPSAYAVFTKQNDFFSSLGRAKIDTRKLAMYSGDSARAQFLESFKPKDDGMAELVRYDRLEGATKTGRLKIVSGPPYMTLNREYRDIIVSRWKGGSVWYLDYSSLEPRTFQAQLGKSMPKDFYVSLARDILGDSGRVSEAKSMFLRRFYGASIDTMAADSGSSIEQARKFAKHVDEDFGVKEMTAKLVAEASATHRIRNHFGMVIAQPPDVKPNVLFNNWVQSTANAVALLGFAKICRAIKKANMSVIPICAIHDAMIVDVHPECEKYVPLLARVGSKITEFGDIAFPMHAKRIS